MRDDRDAFIRAIRIKAARKLAALRSGRHPLGFGLSMAGAVGWSVAAPTLLGAFLGAWWDRQQPGTHSRTLMLLVAGLVLGCFNAARWIVQESHPQHDPKAEDDD